LFFRFLLIFGLGLYIYTIISNILDLLGGGLPLALFRLYLMKGVS